MNHSSRAIPIFSCSISNLLRKEEVTLSLNQNTPETSPQPTGLKAQVDWAIANWKLMVGFAACTLLGALVRNWLDVSKSYKGVVATALWTWGFVLLLLINFVFILITWYILARFLTFSRKLVSPFPLKVKDFGMIILCALLLPMFLSMDLKLSQALPEATELGIQDSSKNTLQSTIYKSFSRYATDDIFNHVDPKIQEEIEPIINGYGCEEGVSALSREINRKLLLQPNLSKEERDNYISRLLTTRDDTQLSSQEKAEDMARLAVEVFNLEYAKDTFHNYVCPTVP